MTTCRRALDLLAALTVAAFACGTPYAGAWAGPAPGLVVGFDRRADRATPGDAAVLVDRTGVYLLTPDKTGRMPPLRR